MFFFEVGKDIPVLIKHSYASINSLGKDRLVNVVGAATLYKAPFVVVDFGTAITFDYVNEKGVFDGGLIVPGIQTSLHALTQKASLLPDSTKLTTPRSFLGRSTKSCLVSGTVHGFAALTDGLIDNFRKTYGRKVRVILTGGMSSFIAPLLKKKVLLKSFTYYYGAEYTS